MYMSYPHRFIHIVIIHFVKWIQTLSISRKGEIKRCGYNIYTSKMIKNKFEVSPSEVFSSRNYVIWIKFHEMDT